VAREYYCDGNRLHALLMERRGNKTSPISNELGKMFVDIVDGLLSRPNYFGYTNEWKEAMRVAAVTRLLKYTHHYDPEKGARIRAERESGKYKPVDMGKTAFNYVSYAANRTIFSEITLMKKRSDRNGEALYIDGMLKSIQDVTEEDFEQQDEIEGSDPIAEKRAAIVEKAKQEYSTILVRIRRKYFLHKGFIAKKNKVALCMDQVKGTRKKS